MPTVVLGVTGSIAAYKAADLASRLVKAGIDVHPVLTKSAAELVRPATFRALTGNPSPIHVFDECYPGEIAHIHLATIADLIAIVPATMNTIARLANGFGNDMLSASVMATRAPVLMAPGMNTLMWENPVTQRNITTLRSLGYHFVEPVSGRLACRTEGLGKMADVETIFEAINGLLNRNKVLSGKRVLVTAGPTREPIDPVRYISNRSSGKMGFAICEAARDLGAEVTVVAGPTNISPPFGVRVLRVESAREMYDTALDEFDSADFVVAAAAVADYRPSEMSLHKLKKHEYLSEITVESTQDILAEMGRRKDGQILVGFAAETESLGHHALEKLAAKNLDWIVANDVSKAGAGFDGDTNIVDIYDAAGNVHNLPQLTKREVANNLWSLLVTDDSLTD